MPFYTILIYCVFINLGIAALVTSDPCFDVFSAVQDDMYMEHHIFSKVITYSPYACAAQCLMSSVCLSFSYNTHRHICHLNDNNTAVTDIVSRDGFIYSDISLWPKSLSGPCSVTSCPDNTRCQVDRLHRASCVPEFHGCGDPPEIADSQREYEGHFLSAMVTYSCNEGYLKCVSTPISVCQSTGQWEDVTGLCGQFRWHNPAKWTGHDIPCGPTSRFKVAIVGTPTEAVRVSLAVGRENDVLLLVEFRFNYGDTVNAVLFNTLFNDEYGDGILLPTMPLTVGLESTVEVSLENGLYVLVVDSAHVYNFTDRHPGVKPAFVRVYGDISARLLEFTV